MKYGEEEKNRAKRFFYETIEKARENYNSYADMVKKLTQTSDYEAVLIAKNLSSAKNRDGYPSAKLLLVFNSLFTFEELEWLQRLQEDIKVISKDDWSFSIDQQIAVQLFKDNILDLINQNGGSYKKTVRAMGIFTSGEITNIASMIRKLVTNADLPNRSFMKRLKPIFSEKDYYIILRAIDDLNNFHDLDGNSGVELGRLMTDDERHRQRMMRFLERQRLLAKEEIEE